MVSIYLIYHRFLTFLFVAFQLSHQTTLVNLYSPWTLVMDQRSSVSLDRLHLCWKSHQQVTASYCHNLPLSSCVPGYKETTFNDGGSSLEEHTGDTRKAASDLATSLHSTPSLSSFHPGWRLYLSFGVLSIVGLAAGLDATSISPALPVSLSILLSTPLLNNCR